MTVVAARFTTKAEGVARALRDDILSGALRPGTQLQQEDIARQLGVSPTPVREAFAILETEGFVNREPHRGATVAQRTYRDVEDIHEVRGAIEVRAAARAAETIDERGIVELTALLAEAGAATRNGDTESLRHSNVRFHHALVTAAGSRIFSELCEQLIALSLAYVPLEPQHLLKNHRDHVSILAALKRRDREGVIAIMQRHVEQNHRLLKRHNARAVAERPASSGTRRNPNDGDLPKVHA